MQNKYIMNIPLQKIYDGFAQTYEKNRELFDMTEVFNSFYEGRGSKKGKLLDLGCGAGEPFPRLFIDRGWNVTGVDFSGKMLELATKYAPEMKTIQADMLEVEKFDF